MRKTARLLFPALAMLLVLPLAQAQEKKYRFEFFGGANYPLKKAFEISSPQSTVPIPGEQKFSWGFQGGVRIGIDGHRHWGQDYTYSYGQNVSRIHTSYGSFSLTNQFHQASTSILFYPWSLDRPTLFPYVTAGLGAVWDTLKQKDIQEANDPLRAGLGSLKSEVFFAFHAGGGVRIRLNDRWGLRLDARDHMSRTLRYGLPKTSSDPNAAVLPLSGVFHQVAVTFGLVVHF